MGSEAETVAATLLMQEASIRLVAFNLLAQLGIEQSVSVLEKQLEVESNVQSRQAADRALRAIRKRE